MTAWDLLDRIPELPPPPPPRATFRGEAVVWGVKDGYQEHLFEMFVNKSEDVHATMLELKPRYDSVICEYRWFSPPHFWACILGEEVAFTVEIQVTT